MAKALVAHKSYERAREYLEALEYGSLVQSEAFDYNTLAARIALAIGDRNDTLNVAARFDKLDVRDPYFREIRHELVGRLRSLESSKEAEVDGVFARVLRGASRYLLLQPNFFGLGINLNALLEGEPKSGAVATKGRPPEGQASS